MEKKHGNVGKYRPRRDVVERVLLKRFCLKCREMSLLGRLRALEKGSRCFNCSVFKCLEVVDPKLNALRREMEWVRAKAEHVKTLNS